MLQNLAHVQDFVGGGKLPKQYLVIIIIVTKTMLIITTLLGTAHTLRKVLSVKESCSTLGPWNEPGYAWKVKQIAKEKIIVIIITTIVYIRNVKVKIPREPHW